MNIVSTWQDFWRGLAARERLGLALAASAVAATLLWWLALAPALHTLRTAAPLAARLDSQLQAMRTLQAQAQALQALPKLNRDESVRALEASVRQSLGASAQLSVQGERATLVLKGTSAQALAAWLAQARVNARALPSEAKLQRSATPPARAGAPAVADTFDKWDGTLVLSLPAR